MSNRSKNGTDSDESGQMAEPAQSDALSETNQIPKQNPELDAQATRSVGEKEDNLDDGELNILAASYQHRFRRNGDVNEINKAIEYGTRALDQARPDHPDLPLRHLNLGVYYMDRFRRLGDMNDLEMAIKPLSRALDLTPDGHQDLPRRHNALGACYAERFQRLGDMNDLEKVTEHDTRALELTPDGHPELPDRHNALVATYIDRFRRLGNMNDIEKAIEHGTRAIDLSPDGHPVLPDRHTGLGVAYTERFRRLGDMNDLEKAIKHKSLALNLTTNGHSDLKHRHANLGAVYTERFGRLGDMNDNERAIEHNTRALDLTPDSHPDLPRRHNALGWSYTDRFRRVGNINDLEKAIEHFTCAFRLTPLGHPHLPDRHNALGVSYTDRFRRLGDINDLQKAIEHKSRALDLTPDGHPHLSERHYALGESYTDRFGRLGDMNDLEKAIEHKSRALDLTPGGHPNLSDRHYTLGMSFIQRFRRLRDMNDLERTIENFTRALDLTPGSHPDLPHRHNALGWSYTERFGRLGDMNDIEKAIEWKSRALSLTPDGHPILPALHCGLAVGYALRYGRMHDPSHLHESLSSFRRASQSSTGPPRDRFQYALDWIHYASKLPQLNCLEAYQTAIDLLPQFIWLGVTTAQRYTDLLATGNLAINATSAAIRHGNPRLALEWLEHTRCVVWNQSTMLRSPLDQLHSSHPALAIRLHAVSSQLHDAGSGDPAARVPSFGSTDPEQIGKHRRRLAMEYSDLVAEARSLPGFEDFLQPIKSNDLIRAARNGPIVAINCHTDQCDALIIMPNQGDIMHLTLPNFTEQKAKSTRGDLETSLRHKGIRERGFKIRNQPAFQDQIPSVLLCLWTDIVKPVLDFLGFINDAPVNGLPHITWCPTGALSFLPLHAAGDYDQPRSRVFDYTISSYTPTISALLPSTPNTNTPTHALRVLAIGQANTRGHAPLPGTTTELACLRGHTHNVAEYSELTHDQATIVNVLDAMEQHDWVHLACHAHQNIVDPTKSGFFLHDGTLDLASISRRSFKNKGLAYLSACQTATGDEKLPDEAIHLASGMLMAGYPSVIATMWSVVDADAPFVADKVYAELMKKGKVGSGEAGKALHDAVAKLRDQVGEKKFGRWVPYIHIGL